MFSDHHDEDEPRNHCAAETDFEFDSDSCSDSADERRQEDAHWSNSGDGQGGQESGQSQSKDESQGGVHRMVSTASDSPEHWVPRTIASE